MIALGAFTFVSALAASIALARMKGEPPSALAFLGRFHPLLVHLPIGMFVLVALAEAATLHAGLRARIDPMLGLALPVTVLAALAAFVLGHFLALTGDYPTHLLMWHRRLELFAVCGAALALIAWTYHEHSDWAHGRALYRALLGLSVAVLSLGAHFGGTITHGDTYLTAYAPAPLKALLGAKPDVKSEPKPAAPSAEPLLFTDAIAPIFKRDCLGCHGPNKANGKLRLDTLEAMNKGGENGPALAPGSAAQSLLMKRMLLPPSDDDHMPPENKPQPKPEEVALIGFWIDRGANPNLRVRDALPPTAARALLEGALGARANLAAERAPQDPDAKTSTAIASTSADRTAKSARATASDPPAAQPASVSAANASASESSSPSIILARKCSGCHGATTQKSGLRVDSLAGLLEGGDEGPALVPGNPNKSHLIERVRLPRGDDEHMPPANKPQLTTGEIAALVSWVQRGAGAPSNNALAAPAAANAASAPDTSAPTSGASDDARPSPSASAGALSANAPKPPASSDAARGAPPAETAASNDSNAVVHGSGCAACTIGAREERGGGAALAFSSLAVVASLWRSRSRRRKQSRPRS